MTKEQFLTKENLENILCDATYGNSSVQIKSPRKVYDKLKEEFGDKWDEMCREAVWAEVLLHGEKLAIYDLEDEDEEGDAPKIKAGIEDFGNAFLRNGATNVRKIMRTSVRDMETSILAGVSFSMFSSGKLSTDNQSRSALVPITY